MEKFKPTVVSSEFVSSVSDAIQNKSAVVFTTSLASSSVLTDDQAMTNNFQKSKSYSQGVVGTVTGYKNTDTNMLVANVKISNKSLNTDMKISTVMLYGTYNGNDILVATARLNEPELLPAFDSEKGTPVTIELSFYIQVSDIENAKVQFNDAGLATNADLQHVDESVVHKTGGEVIDGVKTFNQPINGVADINVRSLWDGYDIDKLKTTGFYVGNYIKVMQSSVKENFSLLVENAGNGSKVKQTKVVFYQSGEIKTLVRFFDGTWSLFTEMPTDDTRLVHKNSDENISGMKTFNDDTVFNKNVTVNGQLNVGGNQKVVSDDEKRFNGQLSFHIDRVGHNCSIKFFGMAQGNNWTNIGPERIKLGFRPISDVVIRFNDGGGYCNFVLTPDGSIWRRTSSPDWGGEVFSSATYITNDSWPE